MKNILICVTGLTPQVVTETLYCLSVQQNKIINELFIITTSRGRNVILGIDDKIKLPPLVNELKEMCKHYKIKMPQFEMNDKHIIVAKSQSIEISDVRNDKHNQLFPNKICEFINEKTKDKENTLFCSISGGRKSMSVDIAFAISLFGRENDKLLHVLTHEDNEFQGFYPKNKKEDKELELSELPFVRLRSLLAKQTTSKNFYKKKFTDIVSFTQTELKTLVNRLVLSERESSFTYGEFGPVRLEPAEIKLYKYILSKKLSGNESCSTFAIQSECPHKFTPGTLLQKISKINKKLKESIEDPEVLSTLEICGPDVYGPTNYGIGLDSSKIKLT